MTDKRVWIVVPWNPIGRYNIENAVYKTTSKKLAEKRAGKETDKHIRKYPRGFVVR